MQFEHELDREEDGRWIAQVVNVPGAMAYGKTSEEALSAAKAIALSLNFTWAVDQQ